jgi:chromosome segregation ATPase
MLGSGINGVIISLVHETGSSHKFFEAVKQLSVNRHAQTGKAKSNLNSTNKGILALESRLSRLESIVGQIGEAVLATTETVESLGKRVDALAVQVQHQGHQVQQQGYQLFALSDAVQTLAENQNESLAELGELTETLQRLATAIEAQQKSVS